MNNSHTLVIGSQTSSGSSSSSTTAYLTPTNEKYIHDRLERRKQLSNTDLSSSRSSRTKSIKRSEKKHRRGIETQQRIISSSGNKYRSSSSSESGKSQLRNEFSHHLQIGRFSLITYAFILSCLFYIAYFVSSVKEDEDLIFSSSRVLHSSEYSSRDLFDDDQSFRSSSAEQTRTIDKTFSSTILHLSWHILVLVLTCDLYFSKSKRSKEGVLLASVTIWIICLCQLSYITFNAYDDYSLASYKYSSFLMAINNKMRSTIPSETSLSPSDPPLLSKNQQNFLYRQEQSTTSTLSDSVGDDYSYNGGNGGTRHKNSRNNPLDVSSLTRREIKILDYQLKTHMEHLAILFYCLFALSLCSSFILYTRIQMTILVRKSARLHSYSEFTLIL